MGIEKMQDHSQDMFLFDINRTGCPDLVESDESKEKSNREHKNSNSDENHRHKPKSL